MVGARVGNVWAKWAWIRTGHTCLGPVWVLCGPNGHGLQQVMHVWGLYGLWLG